MATPPVSYDELPAPVRTAVEARTGPILKAETVSAGRNSALSARVHTATGSVFLKGLRSDHRWVWTQQREADINPYVLPFAPRLLWHIDTKGWNILGFENLDGHHADYSPGSPDLPKVAQALSELADIPCPDIPLRRAEQRLAAYVDDPAVLAYFAGDSLLHTDLNNHNLLITDRAHLVDWGWATRGAAWLDAGYWVIWLISGGHTPAEAEAWAARIPAWGAAHPQAVDAFAAANTRVWEEIAGCEPDAWTSRMLHAARQWRDHRLGVASVISEDNWRDARLIWDYQRMRHEPRPCDVAIALGSRDLGVASEAARLFHAGLFPALVLTGGNSPGTAARFPRGEAVHFRERALELGVPDEAILLEPGAGNTGQNITFSREVINAAGIRPRSVLLISMPPMERRAFATCRAQWPEVEVVCASAAVVFEDYVRSVGEERAMVGMLLGDLQRVIEYPKRGFAIEQPVPGEVREAYERLARAGFAGRRLVT